MWLWRYKSDPWLSLMAATTIAIRATAPPFLLLPELGQEALDGACQSQEELRLI
jgi:hypothetical protein